jgi:hypothetical protein
MGAMRHWHSRHKLQWPAQYSAAVRKYGTISDNIGRSGTACASAGSGAVHAIDQRRHTCGIGQWKQLSLSSGVAWSARSNRCDWFRWSTGTHRRHWTFRPRWCNRCYWPGWRTGTHWLRWAFRSRRNNRSNRRGWRTGSNRSNRSARKSRCTGTHRPRRPPGPGRAKRSSSRRPRLQLLLWGKWIQSDRGNIRSRWLL